MNTTKPDQLESIRTEFRRLSIGRASLQHRFLTLQKIVQYLEKNPSFQETEGELEAMHRDLKNYEFKLYQEYCDDMTVSGYSELKAQYRIAKNFSRDIQSSPNYAQTFHKIRWHFRLHFWLRTCLLVCSLLCVAVAGFLGYQGYDAYKNLSGHATTLAHISEEIGKPKADLFTQLEALKTTQQKLLEIQRNPYIIFDTLHDETNTQLKSAEEIKTQIQTTSFQAISRSVGVPDRFFEAVSSHLKCFPDADLQTVFENEVLPISEHYETVLLYDQFMHASLNRPISFASLSLEKHDLSPAFIPEWKTISQYATFSEQIALVMERTVVPDLILFYKERAPVKEWCYNRKNWDRCYYTTEEPFENEDAPGTFSLRITKPDGETLKVRTPKKVERARYIDVANSCWAKLLKINNDKTTFSVFELEEFWLDFLEFIASDKTLDPLYKSYYLTQTLQKLKKTFPTFYLRFFQEFYENVNAEGFSRPLLTEFKEGKYYLPPEKEGMGRLILADEDDNSRRLGAIVLNDLLQQHISSVRTQCSEITSATTYDWVGWFYDGKINRADNTPLATGNLYVLQWNPEFKTVTWKQIGNTSPEGVKLTQPLTTTMTFQPVWLQCVYEH